MPQSLPSQDEPAPPARPSAGVRWLARALCWLCWLGMAGAVIGGVLTLFNLIPAESISDAPSGAFISSSISVPGDPSLAGLRQDLLYRVMSKIPVALIIWALLSARRSFIGVGRGEYFSQPTILGLRNFALAVLLHMTLAPLLTMIPLALCASHFKGAQAAISLGVNSQVLLALIFVGAVALISTVMAHAAKIADENRQFI